MILDYRDFHAVSGTKGLVNYEYVDTNSKVFFAMDGNCPICKISTDTVHSKYKYDTPEWLYGTYEQSESVQVCPNCGWWEHRLTGISDAIVDGIRATTIDVKSAILKKYDESSKSIPIDILRDYIHKNPRKLYGIDTGKMEELVQSVFSTYYDCEVKRIGKSHDGGVDLLLIIADTPTAVQVKRRVNPTHTEAVTGVRELVGSAMLKDASACIYVSTADHFSRNAIQAAEAFECKNIVRKYDLIDYNSFIDMMGLRYTPLEPSWRSHIKL